MPVVRHAQLVLVRPEKRQEYLQLHAAVWPEVERRISESNIRNFSIFLLDEMLISYFEYIGDDFETDMALMGADPDSQRWWGLTGPCQQPIAGQPDGSLWADAREVWHLE